MSRLNNKQCLNEILHIIINNFPEKNPQGLHHKSALHGLAGVTPYTLLSDAPQGCTTSSVTPYTLLSDALKVCTISQLCMV